MKPSSSQRWRRWRRLRGSGDLSNQLQTIITFFVFFTPNERLTSALNLKISQLWILGILSNRPSSDPNATPDQRGGAFIEEGAEPRVGGRCMYPDTRFPTGSNVVSLLFPLLLLKGGPSCLSVKHLLNRIYARLHFREGRSGPTFYYAT